MTISKSLTLQKAIRSRISTLSELRSKVSTEEYFYRGPEINKEIKPTYDIKLLDQKIVELEKALFEIDAAIKDSNSKTEIPVEFSLELVFGSLI